MGGTTLYDRVIVAGGGSGSTNGSSGWAGGGTSGLAYSSTYQATQTSAGSGGSFGQGANPNSSVSNWKYCSAGGGGGWYGGGANSSYTDSDASYRQQNGGGSGYVWTSSTASNVPSGYNVSSNYYLTDAQTIAGNTSFPAPAGGTETGHSGNGFARITYSIPPIISYSSATSFTLPVGTLPAAPEVEVSNACPGNDVTLTVTNVVEGLNYGWWDNASCNGEPLYEGTSYTINNMQNSATYYVRAYSGSMNPVVDFEYTEGVQTVTVPAGTTSATLEVWGAQGGDATTSYPGGRGGYASGIANVNPGQTLYVIVGGMGEDYTNPHVGLYMGGYNGGGNGRASSTSDYRTGGGGATHVATVNGELRDLSNNSSSVLIVAGGGGGNLNISGYTGGAGGGLTGISGGSSNYGTGGSQSACGVCTGSGYSASYADGGFGYGGGAFGSSYTLCGGGGGWYGGGFGNGGGGGSSYIAGLANGNTIAGNSTMPAPDGTTETGHAGNGYARITFNDMVPSCLSPICTVPVTLGVAPTFTLASSSESSCNQSPVTLTINNPSNDIIRYEWSDGYTGNELSHVVTPGATTTYTVSAFNSVCSTTHDVEITVDALEVTLTGSDNGQCVEAGSEITLTANIDAGQINADEYTLSYSTGTYTNLTNPTYIYSNTSSDGLLGTITFPSGFTFPYCGTNYSTVYVYDGQLRFGSSTMTYNFSDMMASSSYYDLLAAFACDLYVSSNGSVSYQLVTEGGQRAMVVQFKDVTTYSDNSYSTTRNFNFQV